MKDAALSDNVLINLGGRVIRKANFISPISADDVAEEVAFEEVVKERDERESRYEQIMLDWNQVQQLEQKRESR